MAELPPDIIFGIFSRIPVQSLFRFRCVSKLWRKFIDDPHLAIMHLKRAAEEPTPIMFDQCLTCRNLSLRIIGSNDSNNTLYLKKEPVFEFKCKQTFSISPVAMVRGCCNGLMYFSQDIGHVVTTLVVTHPLRQECYELPPMEPWLGSPRFPIRESCGLGFDASTNTFKMVCVLLRKRVSSNNIELVRQNLCTMVHVLGTDSWREIPKVPSYPISGEGVFANGCLHWWASFFDVDYYGRKVIYFDVKKEEFGLINPPRKTAPSINDHLVDMHGAVGLVYNYLNDSIVVWVLKAREWLMHCRVDQKPPIPHGFIFVLGCWNKDGDVLMRAEEGHRLFIYVLNNGILRELNVVGNKNGPRVDIRMYPSSLISIHGIETNAYSIKN